MKTIMMTAAMGMVSMAAMAKTMPDINGQIVDENGEPMACVNVILYSLPDSSFVQGATSDDNGAFNIVTLEGQGVLKVSSVGYETQWINMRDFKGTLQMREDNRMLSEVSVKAQLPKTKLTGNSLVTGIEGSVLGQSGTVQEMLAKVPGMTLKGDDLEVLGRGKPVIYINGRKLQDKEELKRLRSEEVKQVEVITNPGAQYDATITAVVRITTLKRQGTGFGYDLMANNNMDLRYGYNDPNATVNLRYRYGNLDLFGMANYWEWSTVNDSHPRQVSYMNAPEGVLCIDQKTPLRHDWIGRGMNYNLGFNYQINDKHSIGMRVEKHDKMKGEVPAWQEDFVIQYIIGSSEAPVTKYNKSEQLCKESQPYSWEGNAYYNGRVGNLGIDFNFDFVADKTSETNTITEEGELPMVSVSPSKNHMEAGKLVLSYPIWKGQLEVGSEMTFVGRKTSYSIAREGSGSATVEGGSLIPSTSSEVQESNIAAFAQYAFAHELLGDMSLGVRYEHVGFDYTDCLNPDNNMSRYTDDFFPSASWAKQFGNWQTALSYSFKTQRPSYWTLNESMIYINPYCLQTGDPKLKNERIQEVSANVRYKWLTLFAAYERRDDAITQWSYIYNTQGVILIKNINLDVPQRNIAVFLTASPTWGCYNMNWTAGVQRFFMEQTLADPREATGMRKMKAKNPIAFFDLNNAFRFKHSWQVECNANVMTRGDVMNYTMTTPSYNLGVAVQKCWLKNDALCLRATLNDILQRSTQTIRMDCGYYTLDQDSHNNRHRLNVSVRYTFNASQNKYKGTGAGREAASRMSK